MYHITDFEVAFEAEKEDDLLLDTPQQQCLPVDDKDDYENAHLTADGRRYLRQVRHESSQYRVMRASGQLIPNCGDAAKNSESKRLSPNGIAFIAFQPMWNSKSLIDSVLHNFKYTRKLVQLHRNQVSQAHKGAQFDIARAVRTRSWWLEYLFGSPVSKGGSGMLWKDESAKGGWQGGGDDDEDEEEEEDEEDEDGNEDEKLDFAWDKIALGESILASLHLCPPKEKSSTSNAYATGHQPQISFLCELEQPEIVRILRFLRIWLRRDGYRPQLGVWLFSFLALLDTLQPGDVYFELRLLFHACNYARMRTLVRVSGTKVMRDKSRVHLLPSECESVSSVTIKSCAICDEMHQLRKQHSSLCLVMLIIGNFFQQKDLIGGLECAN